MLVDMIGLLASCPRMPLRRTTLFRGRLLLIVFRVLTLVLFEELLAKLFDLKLQESVLFLKCLDRLGLLNGFLFQALTLLIEFQGFLVQPLSLLVQPGNLAPQSLQRAKLLPCFRQSSGVCR